MRWFRWLMFGILGLVALLLVAGGVAYLAASGDYKVHKTVAQDPSIPHVTLDGVTFHAEAFGAKDAPVVIAIHGGPGNDYRYLLPLKALSTAFRVVFYDQRGTGLSPRVPRKQLHLQAMIDDLHRIVTHYGKGKPVRLIGHSWGAMLASAYIGQHPAMVSHVVMAEPGFLTTESARSFLDRFKFDIGFSGGLKMAWLWFKARHVKGPDKWAPDDFFLTQLLGLQVDGNPLQGYACGGKISSMGIKAWRYGFDASMAIQGKALGDKKNVKINLVKGVNKYKGKTLFVAGSCNVLIGPAHQRKFHLKFFPGAKLQVIQGAGHAMFGEKPKVAIPLVQQFLSK